MPINIITPMNDVFIGTEGDDFAQGTSREDVFVGFDGDDMFLGGDGDDFARADDGDDSLSGDAGDDILNGNAGDDSLEGGDGRDLLKGGTGRDWLSGGLGNDTSYGGTGADALYGDAGSDVLFGDSGSDRLSGGDGNDTMHGGSEGDSLEGGDGDDSLLGNADDDRLLGEAGDDTLRGGSEDDYLNGGDGGDLITGGGDDDILIGENGADTLIGGGGDDILNGEGDYGPFLVYEYEDTYFSNDTFQSAQSEYGVIGVVGRLAPFDSPDVSLTGVLQAGEVDRFEIVGNPGELFTIAVGAGGSYIDSVLGLFDRDGNLIDFGDENSPFTFGGGMVSGVVPEDGIIRFAISGWPDEDFTGSDHFVSGSYELLTFFGLGESDLPGLRASPDVDFYSFGDLTPGSTFTAEVLNSSLDSVLGWFDETGQLIAFDDDGGEGALSRLTGIVPDSGRIVLAVSGQGDDGLTGNHAESGDYLLAVTPEGDNADVLSGGAGADRFVVRLANGADVIRDFSSAEGDVIDLTNFGFDDVGEVFDRFTAIGGGTRIDLPFGGSLTVVGMSPADLANAEHFLI